MEEKLCFVVMGFGKKQIWLQEILLIWIRHIKI